jgi:hypothetical protein
MFLISRYRFRKRQGAKSKTTVNVTWAIFGLLERFVLQAFLISNLAPFHRGSTDETLDFIHLNRPCAWYFRGVPPLADEACRCGWLFERLRSVRRRTVGHHTDQLGRRAAGREQGPSIRSGLRAVPVSRGRLRAEEGAGLTSGIAL